MILNDESLREWGASGGVVPYDAKMVQPASYDLTLDHTIAVTRWQWRYKLARWFAGFIAPDLSVFQEPATFDSYTIQPYEFVLLSSAEFVHVPIDKCAILLSKSSTGRRGLEHLHAGWIDPDFYGNLTFEFVNVSPKPVTINAGDALVQIVLMSLNDAAVLGYGAKGGRYQGQVGVTRARDAHTR